MIGNLRGWYWRNSVPVPPTPPGNIGGWLFRYMRQAQGKVCASLSMSIPGANIALAIPSVTMAMATPTSNMAMTIPSAGMNLTTPSATIEIEDCHG